MHKYRTRRNIFFSIINFTFILIIGAFIGILLHPYIPESVINMVNPINLSNIKSRNESIINDISLSQVIGNKNSKEENIDIDKDIHKKLEDAESYFESTIRSCLGDNCFDDEVKIVENNEKREFVRIGILAPSKSIAKIISEILDSAGLKKSNKVEVVYDTHVPAYGYGKNHGWSRIIRIVKPIVSYAYSLLLPNVDESTLDNQVILPFLSLI